jgi:acyl-CoA synthetase (NDP forming)
VEALAFDSMIDAVKAVALMDDPSLGNRLLVVTNGGEAAAADQASRQGFTTVPPR